MSENINTWVKDKMAIAANTAIKTNITQILNTIPAAERPANLTQFVAYLCKQYGSTPTTPEDITKEIDFYKETIAALKQTNLELNTYINEMQAVIQQRKDDIIRLTNELAEIKKQSVKTAPAAPENKAKNGFFWWG
ncbi:MAG: hypothetical protein IPM95_06940 [Sphingobacteriales bacterium]|nr:hypothetical protein [Sphingobacteriales bacterium]